MALTTINTAWRFARLGALSAAMLAMVSMPAAAQNLPAATIQPNEHLTVEGIPAIPAALAKKTAGYNDFRSRGLLEWHPTRREMLLVTRTKGVGVQLHLLRSPMGELEQLTDFPDPVRRATFEPKAGAYVVFERDDGGTEANQLYRLDMITRKITLLTDPAEKHSTGDWSNAGDRLLLSSTQLDKTAASARRTEVTTDLWVLDPLQPTAKRKIAALPGGGWFNFSWSPDDKMLLAGEYKSANESKVWLINVATGERKQILPAPGMNNAAPVAYSNLNFSRDGKHILVTSDKAGEFKQLVKISLATRKEQALSKHISWDIAAVEPAKTSNKLASIVNRDGLAELHMFDAASARELPRPALPLGAVSNTKWRDNGELGFTLNSASSPGEIYALDATTGKVEQWTALAMPAGAEIDTGKFVDQQIIRWKSFDGRSISGLIAKPLAKAGTRFPVLINIHGGPEGQATIGFLGRSNYLINELGIAMIQPNVRGSTGFGKSFLKLDNGYLREDSVKDIGALFDWIAAQPDLDPTRVMVTGGSYGGYMSLAVSTMYPDKIVGAIDVVGISNFVSFLERTESYRRDLRRVEYGDERDPAMRAFMEKIAPLNNARKITKPLFVVQGKNDPRVPLNEAEQMVARVRENQTPVWYLMADNEGHGFARKPNADFYFYSQLLFMETYLLK
jgi:dipeptidyl aminopeptidase/acylaminoacyl peptidase